MVMLVNLLGVILHSDTVLEGLGWRAQNSRILTCPSATKKICLGESWRQRWLK